MARKSDRTVPDLEARRRREFESWSKGTHQQEIADAEGVNVGTVCRDIQTILRKLAASNIKDADKNRAKMLGKLAYAESELLAAWQRSLKPKEKSKARKDETIPPPDAKDAQGKPKRGTEKRTAETTKEGRDGNHAIWERLTRIWELEAKLLGLVINKVDLTTGGEPFYKVYGFDPAKPTPEDAAALEADRAAGSSAPAV